MFVNWGAGTKSSARKEKPRCYWACVSFPPCSAADNPLERCFDALVCVWGVQGTQVRLQAAITYVRIRRKKNTGR